MASSRQPNFGRSNFKLLPSLRRVQSGVPKTAGGTQRTNGKRWIGSEQSNHFAGLLRVRQRLGRLIPQPGNDWYAAIAENEQRIMGVSDHTRELLFKDPIQ